MTMTFPKSIKDNLRFLIAEVDSQIANLHSYLETASPLTAQRILDRSGYAYNLKMRIHSSCLSRLSGYREGDKEILMLRAVELIATELDRIAELCRDCIKQTNYLQNPLSLKAEVYQRMLDRVRKGIGQVEDAIHNNNTQQALKIGEIEQKLDRDYSNLLKRHLKALKRRKNVKDLTTALFVAHTVEQMGDALLQISESIISANIGQPVNTDRYYSLKASIAQLDRDENLTGIQIERIADTRSGSAIAGISVADQKKSGYAAIFKDGIKHKVKEERQGVESWHEIYPGLAPKILSYKKRGQSASLLIEHLAGQTFEHILLHEPPALLKETVTRLGETLTLVWGETHMDKPVSADYMRQLSKRLKEVYQVHPEFRQSDSRIGNVKVPSFDTLLQQATAYERRIKAPFSVYIHGDFNVDNIIYDPIEKRINFIDLHRSRYMDYVQDISVFMVSNYRLQILDKPLRRRIMRLAQEFYLFAAATPAGWRITALSCAWHWDWHAPSPPRPVSSSTNH